MILPPFGLRPRFFAIGFVSSICKLSVKIIRLSIDSAVSISSLLLIISIVSSKLVFKSEFVVS
jgi:hypothetical protein